MKKLFRHGGFTLTETLIGLVVLLILAGTVSAVMMSGFGIYGRTALRNHAQSIGDTAYELISSRLTYAVDLTVSNNAKEIHDSYNVQEDGNVCIYIPVEGDRVGLGIGALEPPDVITPEQLAGMRLSVSASYESDTLAGLNVEVRLAEDDRLLYSRSGTVRLMNASNPELDSFCDVQNSDNSSSDLYFVFSELA